MLQTRVLTAIVLAPVVLGAVLLGEPWISLLVAVVIFLSMVEVISLLDAAGYEPPQVLMLIAGFVTGAAGLVAANNGLVGGALNDLLRATSTPGLSIVVFAAAVLLIGVASFTRSDPRVGFQSWAAGTFGVAYVGLLAPFVVVVAHLAPPDGAAATEVGALGLRSGAAWAIMLVLLVWGYDTGAYFSGRWLGRRRLIDHISPSKTIEGLIGGLVTATVAAGVGGWIIGLEAWHALLVGPLVGLAAQAGDLGESLLKRAAGRKESGSLIPGHGGMLDRVDSFLFAAPVLAGYALVVVGAVT